MQRQQHHHLITAVSSLLMIGSILLEGISKFRLFSRFGEFANDPNIGPNQFAAHIRDAEGWLFVAVICAVVGTLIAAFAPAGTGDRFWWFRGSVLLVLIFWPLLALLYFIALPYPVVAIGYLMCFGILLASRFRKRIPQTETTKTKQVGDSEAEEAD